MFVVLLAIATWNCPWGIVLDVGIVAVWILVIRKKTTNECDLKAAKISRGSNAKHGGRFTTGSGNWA
jgi:hypothetical protein